MPLNTLVTTLGDSENHLLPTPRTSDSNRTTKAAQDRVDRGHQMDLPTQIALLPTPQAGDGTKASSREESSVKRLQEGTHQLYLTDVVQATLQQGSDSTQTP
jgi:hypothetical protein